MSSPPERGVVAAIPAATIDHLAGRPGAGAAGVAHAVVASPAWRSLGGAVAVVREQPAPVLAVLGSFDAAQAARLDALAWQLTHQ